MNSLLDVILPRRCGYCKTLIAALDGVFCQSCEAQLKPVTNFGERSLFIYAGILRQLILTAKFKPDESLSRVLARYLRQTLKRNSASLPFLHHEYTGVTYVPSHFRRRITRGHELPALLAVQIAKHLKIPFCHCLFAARFDPPLSAEPDANTRSSRVADRYRVLKKIQSSHFLLVDDVSTTGATLNSAARTLIDVGHTASLFTLAQTTLEKSNVCTTPL